MFAGFVRTAMQPFVKLLSLLVEFSVHGSYYTALSYDVIYNILVSFTFCLAKVEVIWLVSNQRLLHVLHINYVSGQTLVSD